MKRSSKFHNNDKIEEEKNIAFYNETENHEIIFDQFFQTNLDKKELCLKEDKILK